MGTSLYQLAPNVDAVYRAEATFGALAANDAAARRFPLTESDGLALSKARIESRRIRPDLQSAMGRHGQRGVAGTLNGELAVGAFEPLLEAVLRGTWASALAVASLTLTVAAAAGTVTRATGSWLADGVRVGDVVTITAGAVGPALNQRLLVAGVTATVLTVANRAALADVANVAGCTVQRARKVVMPAAGALARRSFTVEQVYQDADESLVFTGCRVTKLDLSVGATDTVGVAFGFTGQDGVRRTGAQSPYFTTPADAAGAALVGADAVFTDGGAALLDVQSLSLTIDLQPSTQDVIASAVTPDVFDGQAQVTGSVGYVRRNLARWQQFRDETEFTLAVLLPLAGTSDFVAVALPRVKLGEVQAGFAGPAGSVIETCALQVGVPTAANADASMATFSTSAP